MKLLFRLEVSISGYCFVYNQVHSSVLGIYISRREICLLLKNSLDLLLTNTENIQCIQTVVNGLYEACNVLRLKHYFHSPFQKSLMERVNRSFKDRTESFDDYYPCIQKWLQFISCI